MTSLISHKSSPVLELAGRIPTNEETQNLSRGGRNFYPPKWYQFKPRSIMGTPWLEGLIESDNIPKRNRIILADEGGTGKTKASVIVINHILSKNPQKPVLIVCPRRLIPEWKKEIKQVMMNISDRVVGGDLSGAKNVLANPLAGHIYVVSKHSLSKHFGHLKKTNWSNRFRLFSLVVIDEAHQGKADEKFDDLTNGQKTSSSRYQNDHVGVSVKNSKLYNSMKELCNKYSDRVLAVTASPLSLKLEELVLLAKMIGVKEEYYSKLIINNNLDAQYDPNENTEDGYLNKWKKSTKPCRELINNENVTLQDIQKFKSQIRISKLVELLPHANEIRSMLSSNDNEKWLICENTRRNWLKELNPLATFVSVTLRNDLGRESADLFRKRVTWTQFVPLHDNHLEALNNEGENKQDLSPVSRYNQSWPTNHMGDSKPRCHDDRFDYEDNMSHNECPEPRINALINDIFTKDPGVISNSKKKKGAVIFSNVIRTVSQISKWLNNRNIVTTNGRNIKIITHVITGGDVESAMNRLGTLDRDYSLNMNEYHVVIGTSAIQEGISMNWATTVVHWDLVSNPQMLEQRTWRLDRHKKHDCNDSFNVVYLVTNTKSDLKMYYKIDARAKLASVILGQGYSKSAWPQKFVQDKKESTIHTREYDDSMTQYFHPKALDLASIWMDTNSLQISTSEKIRKLQQQSLFIGLSEAYDWGLDEEKMMNNKQIVCSNLDNHNTEQCKTLRNLMVIANNHDRATLQSLHPQSTWDLSPFLDWENIKSSGSGRFFSASINPQGDFIKRILRRIKSSKVVIKGPKSNKKLLVFSVDCTNPVENYTWEIDKLYNLLNEKSSNLYSYEVSSQNVEKIIFGNPISAKMLENSIKHSVVDAPAFDSHQIIDQLIDSLIESIGKLATRLMDVWEDLDARKDQNKESYERTGETRYRQAENRIDEKILEISSKIEHLERWEGHLKSSKEKNHYEINLRYVEGYK